MCNIGPSWISDKVRRLDTGFNVIDANGLRQYNIHEIGINISNNINYLERTSLLTRANEFN